jgi:hypothetical protein
MARSDSIHWRTIVDRFVRYAQKQGFSFAQDEVELIEYRFKDIDNLASLIWFSEAKARVLAPPLNMPYETVLEIINQIANPKPDQ